MEKQKRVFRFDEYSELRSTISNKVAYSTYQVIGDFTILWNLFEDRICNNHFQVNSIESVISYVLNSCDNNKLKRLFLKLKEYNYNHNDDDIFNAYLIRNEISLNDLYDKYNSSNLYDNMYVFLLLTYRVRNNLFHGIKDISGINNQKVLLGYMNNFLSMILVAYNIYI